LVQKPSDTDLILLPENRELKLSEIIDSTKKNYATAFGYRVQIEALIKWIEDQKEIFNK
jgi:hypothetical protein